MLSTERMVRRPEIECRETAEAQLAADVDALLERLAVASPAAQRAELRADILRVAREHAARSVHHAVLAKTAARAARRRPGRGFGR